MLKVLTAAQMRDVDRLTTERYGIPSILLMENAAHAVARVIEETFPAKGLVSIICGGGNNGGDGAALARILFENGYSVQAFLFANSESASGDARINFDALKRLSSDTDLAFHEIPRSRGEFSADDIRTSVVVVDALLGTGVTRPLEGEYASVVRQLNTLRESGVPILSIDIPSGLFADDASDADSVRADITVTFTAPKPANVLPPAASLNGELLIADIGSPNSLLEIQASELYLAEASDAGRWLEQTKFTNASYKNKRGHALIIGGSRDYSGAAVLCGDAAIRSGCGLVTVATPESSRESIVARVSPEVMVRGIAETEKGSAADEIAGFLKNVDAVAVGSGLSSKEDETKAFVRRVVEERQTPVVIDADGLTALSPWKLNRDDAENHPVGEAPTPLLRKEGSPQLPLILTPHEGEFKRLLGVEGDEANEALKDRVQAVRDFATKYGVILVLKGERNLIGAPDGRVVVNPTGNSGLGKAGNGDTLTGILVGFVAQAVQMKIDMFETVVAAVYIAGMAGDVAQKRYGKRVMTASDVRDCLVDVFQHLAQT